MPAKLNAEMAAPSTVNAIATEDSAGVVARGAAGVEVVRHHAAKGAVVYHSYRVATEHAPAGPRDDQIDVGIVSEDVPLHYRILALIQGQTVRPPATSS